MHNTLHGNTQRLEHKYKHLCTFERSVPVKKKKNTKSMLSQSTFSFIHHNYQKGAHTETHKYTFFHFIEVFAGMISAVISPDKLCVLWEDDLYLKLPQNHTHKHTNTFSCQVTVNCLSTTSLSFQILSKLAHTLVF